MLQEQAFKKVATVQDLISKDMFETSKNTGGNEMVELLEFTRDHSVPLTPDQVKATFLLAEMGLEDVGMFANAIRSQLTPQKRYTEMVNKITMADRIKGTAKLDKILKAQVSKPNEQVPNANDMQAKAMREKDLR
jgi:hypothetical protein